MQIKRYVEEYIALEIDTIKKLDINAIVDALKLLMQVNKNEGVIYIFGNGGSAATASHIQNDLNNGLDGYFEKKFYSVCLNDNIPTIMAIANDIGYEEVFRKQLIGRLKQGDILIAISGSGNSPNVIHAVEYANCCGNKVIGITGFDGGKLSSICDISINVPINNMQITEDIHMIFNHLAVSVLRKQICHSSCREKFCIEEVV